MQKILPMQQDGAGSAGTGARASTACAAAQIRLFAAATALEAKSHAGLLTCRGELINAASRGPWRPARPWYRRSQRQQ